MLKEVSTAAIVGMLLLTASAGAATVDVHSPYYPDELGHEAILEGVYGVDFTSSGEDFVTIGASVALSAVRVDDLMSPAGILDAVSGTVGATADQMWSGGQITATAEARYAGYTQQFGYDSGSGFVPLFDVSGNHLNVSGSGAVDLIGQTWSWGRRDTDGTNGWWSVPGLNRDGLDHMVTYKIEGLDTAETVWMLFWEDLPGGYDPPCGSDRDFNDLAVEIRAIPEPATLALLASGGLLALRRRR